MAIANPHPEEARNRVGIRHWFIVSYLHISDFYFPLVKLLTSSYSACIANALIITYTLRQAGDNADVSWNVGWMGLWAFAEVGLGIIVICALSLPKFIESRGHKLRIFFSSIIKPFTSSDSLTRIFRKSATDTRTRSGDIEVEDLSDLVPKGAQSV